MGDSSSKHDAELKLTKTIIKEYRKLQKHDPNHELLQYISDVAD